jgi:hypothetical protein
MGGDVDVNATLRRGDFNQRHFDLSGTTVELRNVQVAGTGSTAWKGRGLQARPHRCAVAVPGGRHHRPDLSDARPLLALFAERTDYPRWTLSLLDSGQVDAQATLRWRPGHLVIDGLQAENDRLSVRARLDLLEQRKRGDLYLRWGCWARASSWMATSASGIWPRRASGLISSPSLLPAQALPRIFRLKAAACIHLRPRAYAGIRSMERHGMKRRSQLSGLLGWLAITFAAAALGAWASTSAASFYATLALPAWAPPAGVFGPVWTCSTP